MRECNLARHYWFFVFCTKGESDILNKRKGEKKVLS
jgi:hypothetical protein